MSSIVTSDEENSSETKISHRSYQMLPSQYHNQHKHSYTLFQRIRSLGSMTPKSVRLIVSNSDYLFGKNMFKNYTNVVNNTQSIQTIGYVDRRQSRLLFQHPDIHLANEQSVVSSDHFSSYSFSTEHDNIENKTTSNTSRTPSQLLARAISERRKASLDSSTISRSSLELLEEIKLETGEYLPRIIFQGYALKMCPKCPILWQKRYFVIRQDGFIYYYTNEKEYQSNEVAKGIIDCSDIKADSYVNGLKISGNILYVAINSQRKRIYKIKLQSPEEAKEWQNRIYTLIPSQRLASRSNTIDGYISHQISRYAKFSI